jgi:hypothetical protein
LHNTQIAENEPAKTIMVRLKSFARKTTIGSDQSPIRQQVKPRKKVRFAEDPIPENDRPSKKANSTQASLNQTIEGRVCKSCSGAKPLPGTSELAGPKLIAAWTSF